MDRNYHVCQFTGAGRVALRKESVDRNVFLTLTVRNVPMSLSARRAWIEILVWDLTGGLNCGRSPQGERG